jgi:hypothetical protein
VWVGKGAVLFPGETSPKSEIKSIKIFDKSWFHSPQVRKKKKKGKSRHISMLGFQSVTISWSDFAKKSSKFF